MAAPGREIMARDLVVVGASAGGVEALKAFLGGLPVDLDAAVLIVLHLPETGTSLLPSILSRSSLLPVAAASGTDELRRGQILVGPPGHHLMVVDNHATLSRGPRENGHRPAVDVLFRSAARSADGRLIGVVLSGALDDGTAGMLAVKQQGGIVMAQDPAEALYPGMPQSVIDHIGADHVAAAAELGSLVGELAGSDSPRDWASPSELMDIEVRLADMSDEAMNAAERPGRPSGFSCPDCQGTLFEIDDSGLVRYRCRVGHAWSALALLARPSDALDDALCVALRSLEERAALSRQLADRASERGSIASRDHYLERATEATRSASVVRELLTHPLVQRGDRAEGVIDDA